MQLSTEQNGGVGAEQAMASGQVDMAGALVRPHARFPAEGQDRRRRGPTAGAPGEREMCAKGTSITSPAQWKGKNVGVTDIGSGTDNTRNLAHRAGLTTQESTVRESARPTRSWPHPEHTRIVCGMTSQADGGAVETKGVGYSAINLASTTGSKQWARRRVSGRRRAGRVRLGQLHKAAVQKVVDALVATMHWIQPLDTAAQIADAMPASYTSNGLTTKAAYTAELATDIGQFLPDGMMPAGAPQTALAIDKYAGNITKPANIRPYTNSFVIAANKLEGYTK